MAAPASPPTDAAAAPNPIVALDAAECHEVLARNRMCVLAVADGGEPYAVPVYYGYDGTTLYLGLAEGRKTALLDRNSRVCVVVAEPGAGDAWCSVVVAGEAVELRDPDARAHGMRVLSEHNRRAGYVPPAGRATPARRPTGGRIVRIAGPAITGRARRAREVRDT